MRLSILPLLLFVFLNSACLALIENDVDPNQQKAPLETELPFEPNDVSDGGNSGNEPEPIEDVDGGASENPSPDAGPDSPVSCTYWQDCPAGDDDNSGFDCVDGQCQCDPSQVYANNCVSLAGSWNPASCLCTFPDDVEGSTCQQYQDCGTTSNDYQTGYDCVDNSCICDPAEQYQSACFAQGGDWLAGDCACSFVGLPPGGDAVPEGWIWDVEPECWWHFVEPVCDPELWVDTSYYREECYYDANNERICNQVYVPDGYWEPGACPAPYWEPLCYSVGTARWGVTG